MPPGVPCWWRQSPTAASTRWHRASSSLVAAGLQEVSPCSPTAQSQPVKPPFSPAWWHRPWPAAAAPRRRRRRPPAAAAGAAEVHPTSPVSTLALLLPAPCKAVAGPRSASPPGPDAAAPRPACSGAAWRLSAVQLPPACPERRATQLCGWREERCARGLATLPLPLEEAPFPSPDHFLAFSATFGSELHSLWHSSFPQPRPQQVARAHLGDRCRTY